MRRYLFENLKEDPNSTNQRTNTWNIEFVTEIDDVPAFQVLGNDDLNPTVEVTRVT